MANPLLEPKFFQKRSSSESVVPTQPMSVQGAVNKTLLLFALTFLSAAWSWRMIFTAQGSLNPRSLMIGGIIVGIICALVIIFKPHIAKFLAPVYAIAEGVFLGAISLIVEMQFPGIVVQAVALTFTLFITTLLLYKFRIVRVTQKLRSGIMIATGGVALVYLLSFILGMFGIRIPFLHQGGIIGIAVSLAIIIIATLNFLLDFDLIERSAREGAPKFMEWYGAFSILVTLVWLYIEVLRLLAIIASDR